MKIQCPIFPVNISNVKLQIFLTDFRCLRQLAPQYTQKIKTEKKIIICFSENYNYSSYP